MKKAIVVLVKTTMTIGSWRVLFVLLVFLLLGTTSQCARPSHFTSYEHGNNGLHNGDLQPNSRQQEEMKGRRSIRGEVVYYYYYKPMRISSTGSRLPDCSHACGGCFPCKRVMVSFKCSVAESCPIVYRCMCRGKYYHVPSN